MNRETNHLPLRRTGGSPAHTIGVLFLELLGLAAFAALLILLYVVL